MPVTTRSIAFFASAKSGLGHLQRIGNIAAALRSQGFRGQVTLFSNATPKGVPEDGLRCFDRVVVAEREAMAALAQEIGATLAVSDMMVVPRLAEVGRRRVLILRETPDDRLGRLALEAGSWDRVIVPNPGDHWLPPVASGLRPLAEPVGWIARRTEPRRLDEPSAGILLATGGGGTAQTRAGLYPILSEILTLARAEGPIRLRHALGPRAQGDAHPLADEVFDPGPDLDAAFRRADLVISTAGYNSVLELAGTDTPALLLAIPRSYDDQQARVRKWGPLLGHGLEPGRGANAAAWLATQAARPRRRGPVDLGPDGAVRAAEILAQMA